MRATTADTGSQQNGTAPFTLAGEEAVANFSGSLDEVFVTATTLSAEQIKHMYEVGYRALQSHGTSLGGPSADANQQLGYVASSTSLIGAVQPDWNNQYMYTGINDTTDGALSKIQINSDTNIKTYRGTTGVANVNTPTGGTLLINEDVNSLAVGYNLEAVGSAASGVKSMGVDNNSTATSGIFYSKTLALPEEVTSVYLWTNTYTDSSDAGNTLTVAASNDGGSNYATCSTTNNDTNQTPQENEYVCRFIASDDSLKVRFTFARTDTKSNNFISRFGVGWTASGADFAENYLTDEADLGVASVVKIKNGGVNTLVGKTTGKYDEGMIGIVSTRPGMTLGPSDGTTPGYSSETQEGTIAVPIALSGRVPVKVTDENGTINKGDYLTSSSTPGVAMKAVKAGKVIGQALENWDPENPEATDRVLVFINTGYFAGTLTASGDMNVEFDQGVNPDQEVAFLKRMLNVFDSIAGGDETATDSASFNSVDDFIAGLTQNVNIDVLESTLVKTKAIASNIIKGGEIFADTINSKSKLVSPIVETGLISPLAGETDINIRVGNEASPSGKLAIQNAAGEEVASIDNEGNATFDGTVKSDEVKTNELTVGKIYADEIVARNGYFSDTFSATSSGITREEIEEMLRIAEEDQDLLAEVSTWETGSETDSVSLEELTASDLYITNQAAINSLSISTSVTIGSDLVFNSEFNSINTLSAPLSIQSLALAPVEIMAGKIRIDTGGNVLIEGNVAIAGNLEVGGEITTPKLSTESLVIASSVEESTPSAEITAGDIETNATVGKGIIPGGSDQITITNPRVTDYTLIYVTPTSSSQNKVLYIKSKGEGFFTAGFTESLETDVAFNWWIVETGGQSN
ncbi:MAG: hypothetical protein UX13_C0011G0015 [Candidatus Woesebacteria bacterium GW2011_GWB1_45_5]|uniref:Uncharacterized protein n=1 Tax=Candidatus Woesebacteria bacterium GW2011_GWB1_45_5 TaxID=1618581 RepID=A0A0G1MQK4_9BACT|nr:MAG: hypothetical protein UX13_C0011G0015 [Candidatus Woesebacteria bacterium GW2011_GWB1_45_5]